MDFATAHSLIALVHAALMKEVKQNPCELRTNVISATHSRFRAAARNPGDRNRRWC
jgi:hypothetical protein